MAQLAGMLILLPGMLLAQAKLDKKQQKLNEQHADAIAAARPAAEAWLKIQDAETYDKSWEAAANYFHSQVPERGWEKRMELVRKSIDPVISREPTATEWRAELPNLPPGEYVAFLWETVFVSGLPQLETVVMMHEDGAWKMVGYSVQ
jgi:Protein of unknown function (DUF4019)